jgi:diguanylate cyclase (GGDEF)-like protein
VEGGDVLIGRGVDCQLRLEDTGISRHHCRVIREQERVAVEDLGSRNGTLLDGRRLEGRTWLDAQPHAIQLGRQTILKLARRDALEHEVAQRLYDSSMRDGLTNLHNRRYFDQRLAEELPFARRHTQPLSLLLLDIDHFKRINDGWGHDGGDQVLQHLAQLLVRSLRREDVVARLGGEEFAVLARNVGPQGAMVLAERIRMRVEDSPASDPGRFMMFTVSIGVATTEPGQPVEAMALIAAADAALYEAKATGRNRCVHS